MAELAEFVRLKGERLRGVWFFCFCFFGLFFWGGGLFFVAFLLIFGVWGVGFGGVLSVLFSGFGGFFWLKGFLCVWD